MVVALVVRVPVTAGTRKMLVVVVTVCCVVLDGNQAVDHVTAGFAMVELVVTVAFFKGIAAVTKDGAMVSRVPLCAMAVASAKPFQVAAADDMLHSISSSELRVLA